MKRNLNFLFLIISVVLIASCTHQIPLKTTIKPNALISKKIPQTVAVAFSGGMCTLIENVRPSSFTGSGNTYNFELGKALCPALIRSVETVYEKVVRIDSIQPPNQYHRILKFSLINNNLDVYFLKGFLSITAKANCSISVSIEVYENSGKLIRKTTITGSGFSSKNIDTSSAEKTFAAAVEAAIQQVSDNIANLLISGFAEKTI